jgi:RimJ/RimL family protein N-acetyltransferase
MPAPTFCHAGQELVHGEKTAVRIEPWGKDDLPLLEALLGDPEMTRHLGGPESPEKLAERHARYVRRADPAEGPQFRITLASSSEAVGWVGYWERIWRDEHVYEIGWSVLPRFQGRGIAGAATAQAIAIARTAGKHPYLHAFPSEDNAPSNAICRKLGFKLIDEVSFEYPAGSFMLCNDWRLDLQAV